MKVWQIALAVVLALGLVAGIVVPGIAAPDKPGPPDTRLLENILKGTVVGLDDGEEFFVIESGDEQITVRVDEATKYYMVSFPEKLAEMARERLGPIMPRLKNAERQVPPPFAIQRAQQLRLEIMQELRPFGQKAGYQDLYLGAKVVVRTVPGAEEVLARTVLIVEPKIHSQVKGVISAISPEDMTLTILPDDGSGEIELTISDRTHLHLIGVMQLEVGQPVRAIYDDDLVARIVIINP